MSQQLLIICGINKHTHNKLVYITTLNSDKIQQLRKINNFIHNQLYEYGLGTHILDQYDFQTDPYFKLCQKTYSYHKFIDMIKQQGKKEIPIKSI